MLASFDAVPSAKGASQHILANAEILGARFDVSLLTLGAAPIPGRRHLPVALDEPNWLRRALAFRERARRVFEENRFDVHHVRSPWEGLAVPPGSRVVYEVNGVPSVEAVYAHPAVASRPGLRDKLRRLEDALLERAELVLTPSEVTRGYLEDRGADPARLVVVPNAPAIDPIAPVDPIDEADPLEPAPRSEEGPVRLCYVGTLSLWQGLESALAALAPLASSPPAFELTIVSPSAERHVRRVAKQADRLGLSGRVTFRGPLPLPELAAFLASQDAALAPLLPCERNLVQGSMPLKILDSMAAGLPVVAPDMPVARSLLGDDYPLYRRYARSSMTELLASLLRSPELRASLGARGRERALSLFSRAHQRDALLGAYGRLGL